MIDTLTYDYGRYGTDNGWVSRYSYHPEWMVSMNNTFYTFLGGNIYKHDSADVPRGTFYDDKYPAIVATEFNDSPLEKKMFKTLHIDSTEPWQATLLTDLSSGLIESTSYLQKEGDWFAYVRRVDSTSISVDDALLTSTQGIGVVDTFVSPLITFTTPIDLSSFAIGDRLYVVNGAAFDYVGDVLSYTTTTITLTNIVGVVNPGDFIVIAKNKIAESYGMRGYYMSVTLENNSDDPVELFAIQSSVFKSFP